MCCTGPAFLAQKKKTRKRCGKVLYLKKYNLLGV
jgi:hypothetical protein